MSEMQSCSGKRCEEFVVLTKSSNAKANSFVEDGCKTRSEYHE